MVTRAVMWLLLAVVASAAAVLSFSALRDLAGVCGFSTSLANLLPIVVDAGAAAGCLVWLRPGDDLRTHDLSTKIARSPRHFARSLTWVLLASSVCGNATVHGLGAYHLDPPWWLVVAVSAVAPAVLGAVVHLAVLVSQSRTEPVVLAVDGLEDQAEGEDLPDFWADAPYAETPGGRAAELIDAGAGRRRLARETGISEYEARKLLRARDGVAS